MTEIPLWYSLYTIMEFGFDDNKSEQNKQKHGIDSVESQRLWDDPFLIEIPARTEDEPRFLVVAILNGKHWSAIITYREDCIRIISVRRAREKEIQIYESA